MTFALLLGLLCWLVFVVIIIAVMMKMRKRPRRRHPAIERWPNYDQQARKLPYHGPSVDYALDKHHHP